MTDLCASPKLMLMFMLKVPFMVIACMLGSSPNEHCELFPVFCLSIVICPFLLDAWTSTHRTDNRAGDSVNCNAVAGHSATAFPDCRHLPENEPIFLKRLSTTTTTLAPPPLPLLALCSCDSPHVHIYTTLVSSLCTRIPTVEHVPIRLV